MFVKSASVDFFYDAEVIFPNFSTFKISCFNCGGEHTLQLCDIPLNQRRIAANRAAHFSNKRSTQERYTTASDTGSSGMCNMR